MLYTYVLGFLLALACVCRSKQLRKIKNREAVFVFFSFLVLFFMSSCRFEHDSHSDFYRNYIHTYAMIFRSWRSVFVFNEELLHPMLRKLVVSVFHDAQAYFFISSFLIIGCHFYFFKKYSPDLIFSILLFYCIGGYFSAHNITRQYIAIAISLLGFRYAIEKKPWKFLIVNLIAVGFHTSAVVVLPLYFLAGRKFTKNMVWFYALLMVVIVVFNKQIVSFMQLFLYRDYGKGYGIESSNPLRLVWVAVYMYFVWLLNRSPGTASLSIRDHIESNGGRFNNLLCHATILYCIFALLSAVNMLMFSRVASYFGVYCILVVLYGIRSERRNNKAILKACFLLLAVAWFLVMDMSGKHIPNPYTPFWEAAMRAG